MKRFFLSLFTIGYWLLASYGQCPTLNPASPNNSLCKGDSTFLKVSVTGTDSLLKWMVLKAGVWTTLDSGFTYKGINTDSLRIRTDSLAGGQMSFRLVALSTKGSGCLNDTSTVISLMINSLSSTLFSKQYSVCSGTPDTLIALIAKDVGDSTGPFFFGWSPKGMLSVSADSNVVTWTGPGKSILCQVSILDTNGCLVIDSARFTVNGIDAAFHVRYKSLYTGIADSLRVAIAADYGDSAGPFSFSWSPGGNLSMSRDTDVFTILDTASALVWKVSVSDTNGCFFTDSVIVRIANPYVSASGEWFMEPSGLGTSNLSAFSISVVNQNTVWASVFDTTRNTYTNTCISTVNGGIGWKADTVSAAGSKMTINCVFARSADTAWVSMIDTSNTAGGGAVYMTSDSGKTWNHQATATFAGPWGYPDLVYFFNSNNGVCVGDSNQGYWEIYTTTNGGQNWTRVPQANIPYNLLNEEGLDNTFAAVRNSLWFTTTAGRIFKSSNMGQSWRVENSGLVGQICGIAFTDSSNGIVTDGHSIESTSDGGNSWSGLGYSGPILNGWLCSVPGAIGNYIMSGMSGSDRGTVSTDNGGLNWSRIDSTNHGAIGFYDVTTGWSGGLTSSASNGMFNWDNVLGIGRPALTGLHGKVTVYPNPMRESATILVTETGSLSLFIYDAMGRLVERQINAAGPGIVGQSSASDVATTFILNRGNLAPGMYFYRVLNSSTVLGTGKISIED